MLQAGTVVAQHLRLVRQLGSGGMGSVWVAEHLRLGGQVAVKFLSTALLDHEGARSRFAREAKWAAKIRSPHVVQVHDHGVMTGDNPVPYIVMELLDGQDLSVVLEHEGPLGLARSTEILEQVCEALTKAHEAGVVHRDIKPENIFLLNQSRTHVKLLDFGVAHGNDGQIDRLTQTGLLLGTAYYMSPEQLFSGKDIDHRADLWALGVLAYQMLTNSLPFQAETFGQLCLRVKEGTFPALNSLVNVPPSIEQFFTRALCTDREGRFQTASEMYDAFEQAAAGVSPSGPETPLVPRKDGSGTVRVSSEQLAQQRQQWVAQRRHVEEKAQVPSTLRYGTGDPVVDPAADSAKSAHLEASQQLSERVGTESKAALSVNTDERADSPRGRTNYRWAVASLVALLGGAGALLVLYSKDTPDAETAAALGLVAPIDVPVDVDDGSSAGPPATGAAFPTATSAPLVATEMSESLESYGPPSAPQSGPEPSVTVGGGPTSVEIPPMEANSPSVSAKKRVRRAGGASEDNSGSLAVPFKQTKSPDVYPSSAAPAHAPRTKPSPPKNKYRGF